MSHHNFDPNILGSITNLKSDRGPHDELDSLRRELEAMNLGATGEFPRGKLCPQDEGEIRFAVAADPSRGVVMIDFGKPVRSLGMTYEEAAGLAELLQRKAWECRGIEKRTGPVEASVGASAVKDSEPPIS